jgi:hypothetical protein
LKASPSIGASSVTWGAAVQGHPRAAFLVTQAVARHHLERVPPSLKGSEHVNEPETTLAAAVSLLRHSTVSCGRGRPLFP